MKLKFAIFDLDGTLLDSMPVWDTLAMRYLQKNGRQARPGLRAALAPLSMTASAEYLIREYELCKDVPTVMEEMNEVGLEDYRDCVQPKRGAVAFLQALQSRGVRMCIATATDRMLVEAALRRLDMIKYFECVLTCTEVGAGKEKPDVFFAARDRLGGNMEDTVVFEDALHAIKTAKAAGFRVAAVPDASARKDEQEIRALADLWFDSLSDAKAALEDAEH